MPICRARSRNPLRGRELIVAHDAQEAVAEHTFAQRASQLLKLIGIGATSPVGAGG